MSAHPAPRATRSIRAETAGSSGLALGPNQRGKAGGEVEASIPTVLGLENPGLYEEDPNDHDRRSDSECGAERNANDRRRGVRITVVQLYGSSGRSVGGHSEHWPKLASSGSKRVRLRPDYHWGRHAAPAPGVFRSAAAATALKLGTAAADLPSAMDDDRAPLGLLIAALGAAVLAVSVFLPWYGVSITASGAASAQQELATVAQQYGNTAFQTGASQVGAEFSALAGRQLATVSAHDVLKDIGPILLVLAAVSLLASLLRLAGVTGLFDAGGGQIALAGGTAALFVLYRMLVRPGRRRANLVSLSLSWGVWLALLGAAAIVAGGFLAGSAQPPETPGPQPSRSRPDELAGPRGLHRCRQRRDVVGAVVAQVVDEEGRRARRRRRDPPSRRPVRSGRRPTASADPPRSAPRRALAPRRSR